MKMQRREKGRQIAHALAGVVSFIKGIDKWEQDHAGIGLFFLVIGVLLFVATLLHYRLAHRIKSFDSFVAGVEAVVMGLIAYSYFHDGKKALPFVYTAVSIAYVVLTIWFYRRDSHKSTPAPSSP